MNLFDQNDEELKKQILLRSLIGGDETSYNKPMIGNEQTAHVARGLSNAADLFVGRKPQFPVGGSSKLAEAMALAQYKDSLEDPADKEMKREYLQARTENARRGPFWASQPGQEYYDARTGQARAQGEQATTETDLMNQVKDKIGSGNGADITPGTTMQAGPYNIPLNPKLDTDQASAISSAQTFGPQMDKIAEMVRGGIFNSARPGLLGKIERTTRQAGVDSGIPMLTAADPQLQEVQGYLNSVRRYAFGEGGKNLTGTEKEIVYRLLDTTGKNDEQIISDHKKAMETINSKANIALGGRNAAMVGQSPTPQIPSFNTIEEAEAKGYKGPAIIGGIKGTVS